MGYNLYNGHKEKNDISEQNDLRSEVPQSVPYTPKGKFAATQVLKEISGARWSGIIFPVVITQASIRSVIKYFGSIVVAVNSLVVRTQTEISYTVSMQAPLPEQ
jgi:hypothetical protein